MTRWILTIAALAALTAPGCNRGGGGGGGGTRMTFHGQPMVTTGQPMKTERGNMVVVGKTDDKRQIFMMRGGGGGGGHNPLFVAVGENTYMVIVPERPMAR